MAPCASAPAAPGLALLFGENRHVRVEKAPVGAEQNSFQDPEHIPAGAFPLGSRPRPLSPPRRQPGARLRAVTRTSGKGMWGPPGTRWVGSRDVAP